MANVVHLVRKGESLAAISKRYYGSAALYKKIAKYNSIADETSIRPGDLLEIPPKTWTLTGKSITDQGGPVVYVARKIAVLPVFNMGKPVIVGSYYATRSLIIDRLDKEVRISGSMEAEGDGATPGNVAMAEATINRYWNQSFPDGRRVICNVSVLRRSAGSSSSKAKIDISTDSGVAHVNALTSNMSLYLVDDRGNPTNALTWAVAHEFGHVLGLDDKYHESFFSKVMATIGKDSLRKNTLEPGYQGNLMAQNSGRLESKNIEDLDKETAPSFHEDDDRIRFWVARHSQADIAALNAATKINMINLLLNGWISQEDMDAIDRICKSVSTHEEGDAVSREAAKRLPDMADLGQRTRMRVILSQLP
jgi:LysM repeat protein